MANTIYLEEVGRFYDEFKRAVFTYCWLFLGGQENAERGTEETFVRYVRGRFPLEIDGPPILLLRCAVEVTRGQCRSIPAATVAALERVILALPCEQRAVLIMRAVLGLEAQSVAAILRMPIKAVERLFLASVHNLHSQLPPEFLKKGA